MGKGISLSIRNKGRIARELKRKGSEKGKRIIDAMHSTALIVESKAKIRVPIDTSRLRNSILSTTTETEAKVSTNVEYARFVEFGTKPHIIRAKNKPVLGTKKVGFFGKEVNHPGTKPKPFLFNSWADEKPALINKIRSIIKK